MKPITSTDDPRYVKAMSHPVRARIMAMLREREASPNALSQWLGTTLGATAYHVRALHRLGLIELVGETRVRGAVEHHYRATNKKLKDASSTAAPSSALAEASLAASAGGFDRPEALLERRVARLDAKGFAALSGELRKMLDRIAKIDQESAKRLSRNGSQQPIDASVIAMTFESAPLADQIPPSRRKTKPRK